MEKGGRKLSKWPIRHERLNSYPGMAINVLRQYVDFCAVAPRACGVIVGLVLVVLVVVPLFS